MHPNEFFAIQQTLLRYCRGVDQIDGDLIRSAFVPSALLHGYGTDTMDVETFVARVQDSMANKYLKTQHRIGNTAIISSDPTATETYVSADHLQLIDGQLLLHKFTGRYVDRWTTQNGEWLIEYRGLAVDWTQVVTVDRTMTGTWPSTTRSV
jgi:SnoaL-like domain